MARVKFTFRKKKEGTTKITLRRKSSNSEDEKPKVRLKRKPKLRNRLDERLIGNKGKFV